MLSGLVVISALVAFTPLMDTEIDQYQRAYYASDRTIFTTYFYWYQSQGELAPGTQLIRELGEGGIADIEENIAELPRGWPGPTSIEDFVSFNATGDGRNFMNQVTRVPLPIAPAYNDKGEVITELPTEVETYANDQNDILFNISDFVDYTNPAWHEWEFRCMMRAGIDVAMPVYWWLGPEYGSETDWSREGLLAMNDSLTELREKIEVESANGGESSVDDIPKLAMFYDTTLLKQLWALNESQDSTSEFYGDYPGAFFNGTGADLGESYWQHQFYLRIKEFYEVLINSESIFTSSIKINGELEESFVVWLYGAGWAASVGENLFDYCREQFQARFGKSLVFVGGDDWEVRKGQGPVWGQWSRDTPNQPDGICGWGASMRVISPQYSRVPVGGYGGGYYNLGAIDVQPAIYTPFTIEQYKAGLQQVIDEGAVWIHIETWNELLEGTDICWTIENGFSRIDATREMADKFHALNGEPFRLSTQSIISIAAPLSIIAALGVLATLLKTRDQ